MKTLNPVGYPLLLSKPSAARLLATVCLQLLAGPIVLGAFAADGPISAVQDALKKENLFLGERTGVLDLPTREALRRFQLRSGLPATGEIDAGTLQALQSSTEARQPTIQTLPPGTKPPVASEETIAKDREFLQKLQQSDPAPSPAAPAEATATAQVVTESAAAPLPAPSPEIAPQPSQLVASSTEEARDSSPAKPLPEVPAGKSPVAAEKSRSVATRKTEQPARTERPQRRAPEPIAERAEPRTRSVSSSSTRVAERDDDPDLLAPNGVRVIRPDSDTGERRTRVVERRSVAPTQTTVMEIRRAEPVESRHKEGFFHRLFKDDND